MKPLTVIVGLVLFLLTSSANSAEMNGYTLEQFGDFAKEWKLVTVRYRKDSGEMRFTYANELAWKALLENKKDYPNGAVFAKIGLMTTEDPSFTSSAVPAGARRTQFMVRNKEKHGTTDGWGYAIFDAEGKTFPGDLALASVACAACHRLVPNRGFVFSQPMGLPNFSLIKSDSWRKHLVFVDKPIAAIPKKIRELLPKKTKSLRILQGALSKNLFSGSLDEIRPLLAKEAYHSGKPTALISDTEDLFSIVLHDSNDQCEPKQKALKGIHTVPNPQKPLFEVKFCQSVAN